eukprot:1160206-Pelagomonas_calceolata.AAC.10
MPSQLYWFKSTIKMYNGLLSSKCETLRKSSEGRICTCTPGPLMLDCSDGFQGLQRCDSFVTEMKQGTPISIQDFTDDLRHRLRGVWRDVEGFDLRERKKERNHSPHIKHSEPRVHSCRPPEQLFRQGAESRWMPEPD